MLIHIINRSLFLCWILLLSGLVIMDSLQMVPSLFDMVWGNGKNNSTTMNNTQTNPMIRLNFVAPNQSVANAFSDHHHQQSNIDDLDFLNQIRINPQDIQFVVPNQPVDLGQRVVEQIRKQLGSKPISLGELKNRNLSFTLEMPGIQFNRTVQTNISDETIVRRQQGQYPENILPSGDMKNMTQQQPGPYVVQSYMKKPSSPPPALKNYLSYGDKPIVYVVPNSQRQTTPVLTAAPAVNNSISFDPYQSVVPTVPAAAKLSSYSANSHMVPPVPGPVVNYVNNSYVKTSIDSSPSSGRVGSYLPTTNSYIAPKYPTYNSTTLANTTTAAKAIPQKVQVYKMYMAPTVANYSTTKPNKENLSLPGKTYVSAIVPTPQPANYSDAIKNSYSASSVLSPLPDSYLTTNIQTQPSYSGSVQSSAKPNDYSPVKYDSYIMAPSPLLNPQIDYSKFMEQTESAAYNNPNGKQKIIYRYIEVCNGKPYDTTSSTTNYGDLYANIQQSAQELSQAVQNGYSQFSTIQSRLESSLSELEQLKQMLEYYKSLVPILGSHAQQYADSVAMSASSPYLQIQVPSYSVLPAFPPSSTATTYSAAPKTQTAYGSSYPHQQTSSTGPPVVSKVYDGGNIKISYHSVEEMYKTNSSGAPLSMSSSIPVY